jgi:thiamine kinase-like enzyme
MDDNIGVKDNYNFLNKEKKNSPNVNRFFLELQRELQNINKISENEVFNLFSEIYRIFLIISNQKYEIVDSLESIYYRKDNNITSNSVFLINFKNKDHQICDCVLKIRREGSPLSFEKEMEFLKKLENKNLIPKQIFNKNLELYRISIEEYMNVKHLQDLDAYNQNHIKSLIEGLCEFNLIDFFESSLEQFSQNPLFYFNFLRSKTLPCSKEYLSYIENKFKFSEDEEVKKYYIEISSIFNTVSFFLKNVYNLLEEIYSSWENKFPCFVFSFIDLHVGNFFIKDEKIKFIDFEDLSYCFIGFDLANHLIESEYILRESIYPFFEYNIPEIKLDEKIIKSCFDAYIDKMNSKSVSGNFEYLSLKTIYRLFMLSNIKSVIEYILMIEEDCHKKTSLDYLRLIDYEISVFGKYYKSVYNRDLKI